LIKRLDGKCGIDVSAHRATDDEEILERAEVTKTYLYSERNEFLNPTSLPSPLTEVAFPLPTCA